jgi:hypothetical protein
MHGNTKMELTEREAAMLQFFIENEGRVVSNRVDGFEWDEDNGTDLINVNTGDRIGLKSPGAGVNFRVPSPGGVVQQWIGGTVENSGHTTFSVQLSYNIPYTPINASLSYSTATQSTINGSAGAQAYQNVNGGQEAAWMSPSGQYLQQVGDNISGGWSIGWYSAKGAEKSVTAAVNFVYNIYNENDNGGYNWGTSTDPFTWTTYV